MLYRLSVSDQRDQFLLKGALLFDLWFDIPHRPTRDVDLLGFGLAEIPHLLETFRRISQIEADDGIVFIAETIRSAEIRKVCNYAGVRLSLIGALALTEAIRATFVRWTTRISPTPFGLTDEFARDRRKTAQWLAFKNKNALNAASLAEVVVLLRRMLLVVLSALVAEGILHGSWRFEDGWKVPFIGPGVGRADPPILSPRMKMWRRN